MNALRTLPEARGRGAARTLLRTGAAWAAGRGATQALLAVEQDNAAALRLYAAAGFVARYASHYRAAVRGLSVEDARVRRDAGG